MEEKFEVPLKTKEEPLDFDDGFFTELKPDAFHLDLSPSSYLSDKEPEELEFVCPADIPDTSESSIIKDEIDVLSDIKQECCDRVDRSSNVEGDMKNGSFVHEASKSPTIQPCFVYLERLDIPVDVTINVQQFLDAQPLQSQSLYPSLWRSQTLVSGTSQAVASGTDSSMTQCSCENDGEYPTTTVPNRAVLQCNSYCQQYPESLKNVTNKTVSQAGHSSRGRKKCSGCQKMNGEKHRLNAEVDVQTAAGFYHCPQCDEKFKQQKQLRTHMKVHMSETLYLCSHCHQTFTHKSNFYRHLQLHKGERPYKCMQCEKRYTRKSHLKQHSRLHVDERPYMCSYCEKSFTRMTHLNNHLKGHSGERPYQCGQCDKRFPRKSNLVDHLRLHSGERPFQCSQCDKSFRYRYSIIQHLQVHSGERPHHCSQCSKSFAVRWHLNRHLRLHHAVTV